MNTADVVARLRAGGAVFAEDEAALLVDAARDPGELESMLDRRVGAGEPIEHIVGWAQFGGLRIGVGPGVFVPRRRTEHLAHEAVEAARTASSATPLVVELCCGSGAVGAVVLAALDEVEMYATDIDPAAVRCARGNLDPERSHVFHGSLEAPLPARLRGRVDVLVANVPYVPTAELGLLPAEARLHEPTIALDGGFDGLEVLRRVAGIAPAWLSPGGVALMEASERQVEAALSALEAAGLDARVSASDDLEAAVVVGRLRCT